MNRDSQPDQATAKLAPFILHKNKFLTGKTAWTNWSQPGPMLEDHPQIGELYADGQTLIC